MAVIAASDIAPHDMRAGQGNMGQATRSTSGDRVRRNNMGVGMQIVCVGFAGSAALEGEAGAQLVRLERFRARLDDCRLAIESRTTGDGGRTYDVRLELLMHDRAPALLRYGSGDDVNETMRRVFAQAEQALSARQADEPEAVAPHAAVSVTVAQ